MAVMASWNVKTWGVSSQRIAALNGVSSSVELDTENSDDKAGSPATKTKALKLQSMSFDFDLAAAVGCDVRSEYESWTALVGQYAPFYLAGRRFGPANLQLTGVSLSDTTLDNFGRILKGKITINLTEYAEVAVLRIYVHIVGDIVAEVRVRRRVYRREPYRVHAEAPDVIQL